MKSERLVNEGGLILVTGGGGFLGGGIVRRLVSNGHRVRSFSRKFYEELAALGVEQVSGDLAEQDRVSAACEGCDLVFHVGARAGIWGDPREFYRANVTGTRHVVDACRIHRISRLVYTSSPSVVFDGSDMEGADESAPYPVHYHAPYPATKAEAEKHVIASTDETLATVSLRPHLIWGPGDTHIVPGIIERGRKGQLRRIGKENKRVDFTFIDNAVEAHILAAERLFPGSTISGKCYFITDGNPVRLWDFLNRVLALAGLPPVTRRVPATVARGAGSVLEFFHRALHLPGEPRMTRFLAQELSTAHWFDIGAARRDLQYRPVVDLEAGLARLGDWLRREHGKGTAVRTSLRTDDKAAH